MGPIKVLRKCSLSHLIFTKTCKVRKGIVVILILWLRTLHFWGNKWSLSCGNNRDVDVGFLPPGPVPFPLTTLLSPKEPSRPLFSCTWTCWLWNATGTTKFKKTWNIIIIVKQKARTTDVHRTQLLFLLWILLGRAPRLEAMMGHWDRFELLTWVARPCLCE